MFMNSAFVTARLDVHTEEVAMSESTARLLYNVTKPAAGCGSGIVNLLSEGSIPSAGTIVEF